MVRVLACRKANEVLDEGKTIEVLSDYYLDGNDPERAKPRKRRVPDTQGRPGRYVPAAVRRAVRERSGGTCEFPGCDNEIWCDLAHDEPHRAGGSREADNLRDLCWLHHGMYDAGRILVETTPEGDVWVVVDPGGAPPRTLGVRRANGNGRGNGTGNGRDPPSG